MSKAQDSQNEMGAWGIVIGFGLAELNSFFNAPLWEIIVGWFY